MSSTLSNGCGHCGSTAHQRLRCARCKVAHYRDHEHQTAHYPSHKATCNRISKWHAQMEAEEQALRSHPGDMVTPADPFTSAVGQFWGILDTREYMRARMALVTALQNINSRDSVQAQLNHLMDMLRLCRGDNLGVRDLAPAMMLRLDKDQECYDFIKWWATCDPDGNYDWGDMNLPYLDIKGADVFEPVDYLCGKYPQTAHCVAMTLLKTKLLLDLLTLQNVGKATSQKLPQELVHLIQDHAARSPIIASSKDIIRHDNSLKIDMLVSQIDQLYNTVNNANNHIWPAMLNPGRNLDSKPGHYSMGKPGHYSMGTPEEMQLILHYSYDAWMETSGAIEVIRSKAPKASPKFD